MQGLTIPNPEYPGTLSFTAETHTPHMVVPVFLIHTLTQPFCAELSCACQQNRVAVTALLTAIDQGALALQKASAVIERKQR